MSVPGHIDALGNLTLTDAEGNSFDDVEVGVDDHYDPADPAPLLIDSTDMVTTGFAGATATRTGAYNGASNNVIRATLTTTPVVVCSLGEQPHIGLWRVPIRVYSPDDDIMVKLIWRIGDGRWDETLTWQTIPGEDDFFELAFGPIDIQEGSPNWEGRIIAKAAEGGSTVDVDFAMMMPGARWGRARAPFRLDTPQAFSARSEFATESGAITGDSLALGGTWTALANSDTTDFNVAGGLLTRTAVSDTGTLAGGVALGRAVGVNLNLGAQAARVDFKRSAFSVEVLQGFLLRVLDNANFVFVVVSAEHVGVYKVISNSMTELARKRSPTPLGVDVWNTLAVAVEGGSVFAWLNDQLIVATFDPEIESTLATGDVYLYDQLTGASPVTRTYDNFAAWVPDVDHVIAADESVQFLPNKCIREGAEGRVPVFEGQHLRIPPSTRAGRTSRVVVKARRLDGASGLPDLGIEDELTASLTVTPRVLLTGN